MGSVQPHEVASDVSVDAVTLESSRMMPSTVRVILVEKKIVIEVGKYFVEMIQVTETALDLEHVASKHWTQQIVAAAAINAAEYASLSLNELHRLAAVCCLLQDWILEDADDEKYQPHGTVVQTLDVPAGDGVGMIEQEAELSD